MTNNPNNLYEFDEYVLNADQGTLWRGKELVQMPAKVFETLKLLVERHGEVLSKEEMLEIIWEGAFVEENNLSQKISMLRKTFGKDKEFIETVPTKGFRFAESVSIISEIAFEHKNGNGNKYSSEDQYADLVDPPAESSDRSAPYISLFQKRHILISLAAVILISLGFVGYGYYSSRNSSSFKSSAPKIRALTDTGGIRFSTISPDGDTILYTKVGSPNLFLKDISTGNDQEVRIEDNLTLGFHEFSSDGKSIYFLTGKRQNDLGDIYKIPRFGGKADLVVKDIWGQFDLSPDGTNITFIKRNTEKKRFELIIKNFDSGKEVVLNFKELPGRYAWNSPPSWSADGKKIAIIQSDSPASMGEILIVDVAAKTSKTLETEAFKYLAQSLWMPSNRELLIIGASQEGGLQIFKVGYPNGEVTKFSNDLKVYRNLSVSKDGKRVLARSHEIYSNIWVLPKGDISQKRQITEGTSSIAGLFGVSWTPNGKIVHYQRGTNESQIRIVDPTDKTDRILAANANGISQYPFVSPDGKRVFFQSTEGKVKVKSVDIENETATILNPNSDQTELYPVVSPDNQWVYFIQEDKDKTAIFRQSLNSSVKELVFENVEFSQESFLAISPDGKYLAFNYKKNKKPSDEETKTMNVTFGFIDLENDFKLRTIVVRASRPYLQWTSGGNTFDYLEDRSGASTLWRRNVTGDSEPKAIARIEKEKFYYFSWSNDENNLAAVIGDNRSDAILFELTD